MRDLYRKAFGNSAAPRLPGGAVSRRRFIQLGAAAGAGASVVGSGAAGAAEQDWDEHSSSSHGRFNEATIAQLQAAMASDASARSS